MISHIILFNYLIILLWFNNWLKNVLSMYACLIVIIILFIIIINKSAVLAFYFLYNICRPISKS